MDFPIRCPSCGFENWVDLENPTLKEINKLVTVEGFTCQCGEFIKFFYWTDSLFTAVEKLVRYKTGSPTRKWLFSKAVRKAIGIREKFDG